MKKLLKTTLLTAGLALSAQAMSTPFYIDLKDNGVVDPVGPIEKLILAYVSNTEVNLDTGAITTRAGNSLVGYDFDGAGSYPVAYTDFADLVTTPTGGETNTFTSRPNFPQAGLDLGNSSFTKLTFDLFLEGTFDATSGITYTSGNLDILSYNLLDLAAGPTTLITTSLSSGGIFPGEQVVNSFVTDTSITPEGEDTFYFEDSSGFKSFEDYIADTTSDILLEANQTVTLSEFLLALTAPDASKVVAGEQIVLVSDDHEAGVQFTVPSPSTIAIFSLSLIGLAGISRKRSKK